MLIESSRFIRLASYLACSVAVIHVLVASLHPSPTTNKCTLEAFSITSSAHNKLLIGNPRVAISSFDDYVQFATQDNGVELVSATHTLKGFYCSPTRRHKKYNNPLLLFIHGGSYTSTYWSALAQPSGMVGGGVRNYSWVDHALREGYRVLALDRLGNGLSDAPDPYRVVQQNFQSSLRQEHDFIGYVGHSYGSLIGAQIAALHPDAAEAYILTGICEPSSAIGPGQFNGNLRAASDFSSRRFPSDRISPGYVVMTNRSAREEYFYSNPGEFDPKLLELDFRAMSPTSLGEVATQNIHVASNYTGAVFVMTGQNDAALCGTGIRKGANCGSNEENNQAKSFVTKYFPNASKKESYLQPRAGHNLLLHYSWHLGVSKTHDFLKEL